VPGVTVISSLPPAVRLSKRVNQFFDDGAVAVHHLGGKEGGGEGCTQQHGNGGGNTAQLCCLQIVGVFRLPPIP
jgi:hypothetical protein